MTDAHDDLKAAQASGFKTPSLAMHDPLTGLPNPELFADRLMIAISLAKRNGWFLAVMFINLDRFKSFNEAHGQDVGDAALHALASRLSLRARGGDTVSRIGDDELLYLLVNPDGRENIRRVAQRVRDRLLQPVVIDTRELVVAPRIGIAVYPDDGVGVETLTEHARVAMRQARSRNLNYMFFEIDEKTSAHSDAVALADG